MGQYIGVASSVNASQLQVLKFDPQVTVQDRLSCTGRFPPCTLG